MNRILIVDVPEGWEHLNLKEWRPLICNMETLEYADAPIAEITLPTEEEIFKEAKSLYCGNADSKDRIIFQYACGWYRNEILKQLK